MNQAERDAINHPWFRPLLCLRGGQPPFLIVYVIHQNCHLQPLRAGCFISKPSSGLCFSSHFYFLQKCHPFINLARHEIREAVHQSRLPTERTEPCMSPLHSSQHTHWHTHKPSNMWKQRAFVFQTCHSEAFRGRRTSLCFKYKSE